MSAGGLHTCAIVGGGAAKCWGANDSGQLGDNSIVQRHDPRRRQRARGGVAAIVTGATHSCALTVGGRRQVLGRQHQRPARRQHDDATADAGQRERAWPSGVQAIAAGDTHTCALTNAGGVKCWGQNSTGQLGDGTTTDRDYVPVDVSGLTSGVIAIEAGAVAHVRADDEQRRQVLGLERLRPDRRQHDDAAATRRSTSVGLTSGVSAIAVGQYHSCALVGGGVKCWGWNDYGQVGDNSSDAATDAGQRQRSRERRCRQSPRATATRARS